jgi:hypothetical protein
MDAGAATFAVRGSTAACEPILSRKSAVALEGNLSSDHRRLLRAISDSVWLARMVLQEVPQ